MKLSEILNEKLEMYHGYSGEVADDLKVPIHLAYDEKTAKMYAYSGKIAKFEVNLKNPLSIKTDEDMINWWAKAGLEIPKDDPATMNDLHAFEKFVQSKNYDGVIFKNGLWDSSQLFQDTFGQDEVIVFDASRIKLLDRSNK